jgi:hypothetical protein
MGSGDRYDTEIETFDWATGSDGALRQIVGKRKQKGWKLHAAERKLMKTKLIFHRPIEAPRDRSGRLP